MLPWRRRRTTIVSAIFLLTALLWNLTGIVSLVRELAVPRGQPYLNIPLNTSQLERGVVLAKTRHDDIRWTLDFSITNKSAVFVYSTDSRPERRYLQPQTRKGREAAAYLSYITDYYHSLPSISIFVHAAEDQWHNDIFAKYDNQVDTIRALRTAAVNAHGFVNLRCRLQPSCPIAVRPFSREELDIRIQDPTKDYADAYTEIFNVSRGAVPYAIGAACCAQFAVSRDQIRKRPREDYQRILRWIDETNWTDSYGLGLLFEYLWHLIFGMHAIHCPDYDQCRCDNFGWCGPFENGQALIPAGASSLPPDRLMSMTVAGRFSESWKG